MATPIKQLLKAFIQEKQKKQLERSTIEAVVKNTLKGEITHHIRLTKTENHTVFFCADSSTWLYQFTLLQREILKEIKKETPQIAKIKIEMGEI